MSSKNSLIGVNRPPRSPQVVVSPSSNLKSEPVQYSDDTPVPAALAALLHQSDRSGRQQFTHSPHGASTVGVTPGSPLATTSISLSGLKSSGSIIKGGNMQGSQLNSTSNSSPLSSEKKPWRLLTALTCCMGLGSPNGPASSSPPVHLRACADTPSSPASNEDAGVDDGIPTSLPPQTPLSRRPGINTDVGPSPSNPQNSSSTPTGATTPSHVLSPTTKSAAARAARQMAAKQSYDSSSRNMTPWGSKHPSLLSTANPVSSPSTTSMLSRIAAAKNGHTGGGRGIAGAGASPVLVHPHANMGPSSSPHTPRQLAALDLSKAQLGISSPEHLGSSGILNDFGHPIQRINNVRRAASSNGEGPLLAHTMLLDKGRHCLVLDLDETLVHSSFKPVPNADYILPVEIEGVVHQVYVIKRPGCDEFITRMGKLYEVVVFTASLEKYADPLLDILDPENVLRARLFREACVYHGGNFVKDLSLIGRDSKSTIIVDNSPASFLFQPENAILCDTFIDSMEDKELWYLADFLTDLAEADDVREGLAQWAAGTYSGPHGFKRRVRKLSGDSDE